MMTAFRRSSTYFVFLLLVGLWGGMAAPTFAIDRKPDNSPACEKCCPEEGAQDSQSINVPCRRKKVGSALSFTEGTLSDTYPVFTVQSASGPTLELVLTYTSFNADGSNFRANTVMGFGWTHSYNLYLTQYRMDVFKDGGNGLTRKFVRNPDGSYDSPEGTAETLVRNAADDTFDIRLKDGTEYHFAKLTPAPFLMPSPPYYVTRITDRNGRTTTLTYNSNSLLDQITDPYGRRAQFTYNAQKKLETITDPLGRVTRLQYDPKGYDLVRIIDPLRNTVEYTYNVQHQIVQKKNKSGHRFVYEYNAAGKPVRVKDGNGQVITALSNPTNWAIDTRTLLLFTKRRYLPSTTTEIDGRGNTWQYAYNRDGSLTKVVAPDGSTTTYTYDPVTLNLATGTDANGHTTSYTYDTRGNRLTMTDALGHVTTYTYEPVFNQMTSMTDSNSRVTTYAYDTRGNRIRETDPLDHTRVWTYAADGNILTEQDKNGNVTMYEYDMQGNRTQITDAVGNVTMMTYDAVGNLTSRTNARGFTTMYDYDALNRLVKETDALGQMTQTLYDDQGNRVKVIDRNDHSTEFQYDLRQRLVTITDALLQTTMYTYDGNNNPTQQIDAEGKVTYFKYDSLNRLILQIRKEGDTADVIDASDAVTRFTYDAVGNRLTMTEPNDNKTTYVYDELNRQVQVTNATGDMTLTTYDPVSNVKTVTAPNRNLTTYTYDALDRVLQIDDSGGQVAHYTYDNEGRCPSRTDGNGNGNTNVCDAIYRLVKTIDPLGRSTLYNYDQVGNLLTLIDREGNATTYLYDDIDRRTTMTDAMGNVTKYEYDGVGNLTRVIDANDHATAYAYDQINRLIKETYADGRMRTFTYDGVGHITTRTDQKGQVTRYAYNDLYFLLKRDYPASPIGSPPDIMAYDLSGRMLTAERGGWRVTFDYDGANRVTRTTQDGEVIDYVYNIPGRTRLITYPGGRQITEQKDPRNRLEHILPGAFVIQPVPPPPPLVQYTYDPGNRVVSRTYRNGVIARYSYNDNNWILSLDHTGATHIAGFTHDFDKEGNKQFEHKLPDVSDSEAYQYDKIYRLIDFKVGDPTMPVPSTQTQYILDGVGNWEQKISDGITENRMHSVTNEITKIDAVPIQSDPNGNTIEDEQYRYDYDEENRLIKVTRKDDSRVVGQYQYDALSRRIKKIADPAMVSSPVETRYFYDDARIIEEQDTAGATLATYVYGNYIDEVLTMDRAGETSYYHQNSLWSVEAITDRDANVVERYSYDAYGLPTILNGSFMPVAPNDWGTPHSPRGNPWMFTGRQFDEETGTYFYRARYYDPVKGRFLQRDPLEYQDGMNLYEYVRSNPTHWTDPTGQQAKGPSISNQREAKDLLKEVRSKVKPEEKERMKNLDALEALISDPKTTNKALINLKDYLRAQLKELGTRELSEKLAKTQAEITKCQQQTREAREAFLKTLDDVAKSGIIPEDIAKGKPIAPKPKE